MSGYGSGGYSGGGGYGRNGSSYSNGTGANGYSGRYVVSLVDFLFSPHFCGLKAVT